MGENKELEHALLSASSSHRWLICTPSVRLEEKFPNKESSYMKEGTLAHAIAECKVRNYFLESGSKASKTRRLNKFKKEEGFEGEMMTHTETYLEYIKGIAMQTSERPFIAVEQKVDYSQYAPEGFGTADCILISKDTLHIVDFKYGKGVPVDATDNPQLKLYALGAMTQFGMFYDIENVELHIVQPRLDNISEYQMKASDLLKWGNEVVKPKANQAFMGLGEYVQGDHCRFCKAKGACEFRAKENMQKIEKIKKQCEGTVSNADVGEFLTKLEGVDDWIKDLRNYALEQLLKGEEIPGYKAVEGRSNRKITDIDKAFEELEKEGYDEAVLYERKPITLTALEKLVGKTKLTKTIGNYIEKPKGAPTLAKLSDKRESYRTSAAEEFKNLEEEEN